MSSDGTVNPRDIEHNGPGSLGSNVIESMMKKTSKNADLVKILSNKSANQESAQTTANSPYKFNMYSASGAQQDKYVGARTASN